MGSCTIALVNQRAPSNNVKHASTGLSRMAVGTVKCSNSYSSGGDSLDFGTSFGMIGQAGGSTTTKEPTYVFAFPSGGYVPEYDATNKKMLVYRQSAATSALTEATSVDLSAVTFNCLVFW